MAEECERFFSIMGLDINCKKSATSSVSFSDTATLLERSQGYKYLGLIEDSRSRSIRESFEKIKNQLYAQVNRLFQTRLNGKILVK